MSKLFPIIKISRLFKLFGFGIETLSYLAYLIIIVSAFSLFINLFNSMNDRKYEMALIRTLGASRFQLSKMIIFERWCEGSIRERRGSGRR